MLSLRSYMILFVIVCHDLYYEMWCDLQSDLIPYLTWICI